MTTHGLISGAFLPPQVADEWLVNTAAQLVQRITIAVTASATDPVPLAVRQRWLRALFPAATICTSMDELGGLPPVTHVYGMTAADVTLAADFDALPVVIDPDREALPPAAGAILAAPFAHWDFLPGIVRSDIVPRVCLFGPESTGKTTLARRLARHYGSCYVPEYGRIFEAQYQPQQWQPGDLVTIAQTHGALRKSLAVQANRVLLEDTDELATAIWSRVLAGTVDDYFTDLELADLYLLTAIDVPWIADGMRQLGSDQDRRDFFADCERELANRGARYQVVSGSWAARERQAIHAINGLLDESPWARVAS